MKKPKDIRADKILDAMAATYRERNTMYGQNYRNVGAAMAALFPDGVMLKTKEDFIKFHFLDWVVGKLSRFANSKQTHLDSVHDGAVYLAMIEAFIKQENENGKQKRNVRRVSKPAKRKT